MEALLTYKANPSTSPELAVRQAGASSQAAEVLLEAGSLKGGRFPGLCSFNPAHPLPLGTNYNDKGPGGFDIHLLSKGVNGTLRREPPDEAEYTASVGNGAKRRGWSHRIRAQ